MDAAEGTSSMIGHTVDTIYSNLKYTNQASKDRKQRLKEARIKKRLKKLEAEKRLLEGPVHVFEYKFEAKPNVPDLKKETQGGIDLEENDYTCKICGIICYNEPAHTTHLERQHGIGKANTCPLCLVVLEDRVKR